MDDRVGRRQFVATLGMTAAAAAAARAQPARTDRRAAMLSLRDGGPGPGHVPAAFFIHFDAAHHFGTPAVEKHLEYFRFTGMDFVKVQYEQTFPPRPEIRRPGDWKAMPRYGLDFYRPQLEVVEGLVKAARGEALVLVTLYSAFMCAGHTVGRDVLRRQMDEDPGAVERGLDVVGESLLGFVRECRSLGADGFYASTQGGEQGTLREPSTFERHVMPHDLRLLREIDATFDFNILHVCDYEAPYGELSPFERYPGHVVSCSPRLTTGAVPLRELARRFGRPIMGGMDRKGAIATGTDEEIRAAAEAVLREAPERFVLGADCTVPSPRWEGLRAAIETAHAFRRS
jgi:uroporphyrinogen decarboxylase